MLQTKLMLEGADEVLDRIDRLGDGLRDKSKVLREVGSLYEARERAVFGGAGWSPLKPSTIKRTGSVPLVDFGLMRAGVISDGPIWEGEGFAAAYGAPAYDRRVWNLAVLHSSGFTDRSGRKVPARMVVPRLRAAERRAWTGAVRKHVEAVTRSV